MASALLTACTGSGDAGPTTSVVPTTTTTIAPRPNDGVLVIGAFLPSTGAGASLGGPMLDAVDSSVRRINEAGGVLGEDVVLEVRDEAAGAGLDELLAAGVDAIVGPASSLVALSQLDATVQSTTGVVTCSPSATALALDEFPDSDYFFRTVPSDSLQMVAIARRAQLTGVTTTAIAHLDDPYGRGLADSLVAEIAESTRIEIQAVVPFSGDDEDLSGAAANVIADEPGLIVVLGDADDGSRFLRALDIATAGSSPPVIVNDTIRTARQTIADLSPAFREQIDGIAPRSSAITDDGPEGAFAAHAADCVNLIALAAVQVDSDAPSRIRSAMPSVSTGGRVCTTFADCSDLLDQGLNIDFSGASGELELSPTTGDPQRAWFEIFRFDGEGNEVPVGSPFDVSDVL